MAIRRARFGSVEAATILIVLDSLFAVFVVLQLAYLFGGRDTMSAAGMTYSDMRVEGSSSSSPWQRWPGRSWWLSTLPSVDAHEYSSGPRSPCWP